MIRIVLWLAAALAGLALLAPASAADIEIVNRTSIASPLGATGNSYGAQSVSHDGRFSLFFSEAGNLVAGDTNHSSDLFLYDHQDASIERVSLGNGGVQANGSTASAADLSDDARYVVFESVATNLVAANTYGVPQIYLRDRVAQTTTLVSRALDGNGSTQTAYHTEISADGRYAVFVTNSSLVQNDTNGTYDIYRYDRNGDSLELISVSVAGEIGNSSSVTPRISADGRYVAFATFANNLFPGDTNLDTDIVLRDTVANTNVNASIKPGGGQFVGYRSLADGNAVSADGRYVLFNTSQPLELADTNTQADGFRFDRTTGLVERVTRGPGGALLAEGATGQALSADGNHLLMESTGGDIIGGGPTAGNRRSYVRDITNGAIALVKLRPGPINPADDTYGCELSGDALAAYCDSRNRYLVDNDGGWFGDVFRSAIGADGGQRVSRPISTPVAAANDESYDITGGTSADGRFAVFSSVASNLVVGDFNGKSDIFVRDRLTATTQRISLTTAGAEASCDSYSPHITPDGRYIVFASCGALDMPLYGSVQQIYRYDRVNQSLMRASDSNLEVPCNADCRDASISDDGQRVTFFSRADNLGPQPPPGGGVFVRFLPTGPTVLINGPTGSSVPNGEPSHAAISGSGRYVYFSDTSSNLVAGDTNGAADVFAFDFDSQTLQRVSLAAGGAQLSSASHFSDASQDGRFVVFQNTNFLCPGSSMGGVHVLDRVSGQTHCASVDDVTGENYAPGGRDIVVSADGNRVAFTRSSTQAVMYDHTTRLIQQLTPSDGNGQIRIYDFCGNGECVLFWSAADNLVANDENGHLPDVFIATNLTGDLIFRDVFGAAPP